MRTPGSHNNTYALTCHRMFFQNGVWTGLLANANVGGENFHQGSVLSAVLGTRAGIEGLPPQQIEGLYHEEDLQKEIDDFVKVVLG